jgi:capsule polysaccharide export protein KpsE/RkpR
LGRKLTGEMEAYFLAIKNVETAKIALEQQTPMLQPIDKPIYPLRSEKPNAFRALIMGLIIGALLGFIIIVGQKAIRDFIKYSKENKSKIDDTTLTNSEPIEITNFPTP